MSTEWGLDLAKWLKRSELIPVSVAGMKRLVILHFLLPPGWDAGPSQGYPQALNLLVPICTCVHLGGERHCGSKVSCPRTQHNVPSQDSRSGVQRTKQEATVPHRMGLNA